MTACFTYLVVLIVDTGVPRARDAWLRASFDIDWTTTIQELKSFFESCTITPTELARTALVANEIVARYKRVLDGGVGFINWRSMDGEESEEEREEDSEDVHVEADRDCRCCYVKMIRYQGLRC